ncbi:MAG TPA: hypothetical protein VKB81_08325 [Nitrospira sp.]|nr:hypothetical protein [Nitrospira sp.]
MGRRRGFLPPAYCQQCGKAPHLGQTLWPGDKWRCVVCLEDYLPGKDSISKSMHKTLEYAAKIRTAFDLEAVGLNADGLRNQAEWARAMGGEITRQGTARAKTVTQANGEVLPSPDETRLYDTLAVPDLAAVEASLDRTRLLLPYGTDVAAMALDAANSIQAENSLEKMLAHQLAALHKQAMELMAWARGQPDAAARARCVNAAVRCMTVYQQGLLTLQKLRQGGHQRISVQYVNVSEGAQAVVGNVVKAKD